MSCCTRPNRPSGVKWWGLFDAPFQEAGWRGERGRVARKKRGAEAPGQREIFFVPRTRLFFFATTGEIAKVVQSRHRSYAVLLNGKRCCWGPTAVHLNTKRNPGTFRFAHCQKRSFWLVRSCRLHCKKRSGIRSRHVIPTPQHCTVA